MFMLRWFALLLLVVSCEAQSVVTLLNNGSSANRVDMVIVGDGYTLAESGKFESDANAFVNKFFIEDPYLTYKNYFNVHALFVASNQSGADHPERSVSVDTAFDAGYNCSGIQRLICVNTLKVNAALIAAGVQFNMRDIMIVLVNDSEYGGSGGATAVTSTHPDAPEIILHEVGHSFGLLADEYTDTPPECDLIREIEANVTRENTRDNIKWRVWIGEGTVVPTNGTQNGIPGAYQGAQYCVSGKYRPTYNSKMRSLGRPFEQINSEQLIKRIYNWVSPIESVSPAAGTVIGNRTFGVTAIAPLRLVTQWKVDGKSAGTGTGLLLSGADTCPHQVSVTVADPTPMVRNDPAGLLMETLNWTYYPAALESPQAIAQIVYNAAAGASIRTVTPDSWVTLKGSALAKALNIPEDLRTNIDDVTVVVSDSAGVERLARLQFVSAGQINFILPPATALGTASIRVCRPGASTSPVGVTVTRVAPGLFAANSNGNGLAAAYVLRVKSDGAQSQELVGAGPIAPADDTLYLILYGTGLKNPAVAANMRVTVGGVAVPIHYAGPQNQFDALDQVNVGPLPASVTTPGLKDIVAEVGGVRSNIVQVEFK